MKIAFFVLSLLSLFSLGSAFKGCENKQLNELCQSKVIDNCYTCVKVINDYGYPHPPVCVPVFHHSYGTLDNYPRDKWNCTVYRPTLPEPEISYKEDKDEEELEEDIIEEVNDEVSSAVIDELENEANVVEGICQIDEFIYEMCDKKDNNGFCLIASYIHDMCNVNTTKSKELLSQNNEHNEEREFQTMGCGSEKFKCMLKKSCRNLVKSLDKCDDDLVCIYNIIVSDDIANNETFQNLVKCMFPH